MSIALPLNVVVPVVCITKSPPLPLIKLVALPNLKLGAPKLIELPLAVSFAVCISTSLPSNFINLLEPLPAWNLVVPELCCSCIPDWPKLWFFIEIEPALLSILTVSSKSENLFDDSVSICLLYWSLIRFVKGAERKLLSKRAFVVERDRSETSLSTQTERHLNDVLRRNIIENSLHFESLSQKNEDLPI